MAGRNANVFYELGIRHAVIQPSVLLVLKEELPKLPFDVSGIRTIPYTFDIAEAPDHPRAGGILVPRRGAFGFGVYGCPRARSVLKNPACPPTRAKPDAAVNRPFPKNSQFIRAGQSFRAREMPT